MPKTALDPNIRKKLNYLRLADPDFDKPGSLDMVLGVQHCLDFVRLLHTRERGTCSFEYHFVFLIIGKISSVNISKKTKVYIYLHLSL